MAIPVAGIFLLKTMTTMKKYILLAAAAIAALSACNNESDEIINTPEIPAEEIPSVQAPVFTASIEGSGTRTAIDGNKVNWVNDDEVLMVYVGGSEDDGDFDAMSMATYQATPSAVDATKATLTIKNWLHEDENANILMFAIYPASLFDLQKGGINFPATQVYAGDGQIPYAPIVVNNTKALGGEGEAIPSTLNFKNGGAMLKITVPYSQMHSVSSITVSSNLAMNGAATIGGSGNLYIQEPETVTTENSKITLDCGTGVTIPEGSDKTFYVSILAPGSHFTCQYDYLQIDVTDGTTTKSMRTMKTGGIEIVTNKIYPITFAENYIAPAVWACPLTLGKETATSIVIETGVNVGSYTTDGTHKKLNAAGTLWEFLDGQVLRIQTSADKILGHDSFGDVGLFDYYVKVESITGLSNLDMSQVTNMKGMFYNCQALTTLDVSSFDTHNVTDMSYMFKSCTNLISINLGTNFTTQSVTTMSGMFSNCEVLSTLAVSNFNTSKVTDMDYMFYSCLVLPTLDLSNFNTSNVTDMDYMFGCCFKMASLTLSSDFKLASGNSDMFYQLAYVLAREATCVIYNAPDDIKTLINTNASNWLISGKYTFETK